MVRLVGPSQETRAALEKAVAGLAEIEYTLEIPFVRMKAIEGLKTMVAAFAHRHSRTDQLGRAAAAGAGLDPRGAHTG